MFLGHNYSGLKNIFTKDCFAENASFGLKVTSVAELIAATTKIMKELHENYTTVTVPHFTRVDKLNAKSFMKTFQKRLQQDDEKEERVSISLKPFDEKNQEIFANSLKSSLSKINIERIQNHSITNGFNEPVHQFKMNNINTEFDVEIPKVKKEIDGDMKSNSHTVKYDGNNFAQTENIPKELENNKKTKFVGINQDGLGVLAIDSEV